MRSLLIVFLFLLTACSRHKDGAAGGSASGKDGASEAIAVPPDFYKRYEGTIAGKDVVVWLSGYGGSIEGSYKYAAIGKTILLSTWKNTEEGSILNLTESAPQHDDASVSEEPKGPTWRLNMLADGASGEWRSADGQKTFPILLKEAYPEGVTALDAFNLRDSAALLPGNPKSPVATATYYYLLPRNAGPGSFLYDALKEQIAPGAAHGDDVETALRAEMAAYFADYRSGNESLVLEPDADLESFAFAYTSDDVLRVLRNEDYWLVTEKSSSSYTGGAHGNYGSSYANIDISQKRIWKLADVMSDTTALRPLLSDAAIAYFELKPGEGMEERLLVDEVPPTENFYLGDNGLHFVYNPYEIASYADGQIDLEIPYKKLMPLLTPSFRQRARLSYRAGTAMRATFINHQLYADRRNATGLTLPHRPLRAACRL